MSLTYKKVVINCTRLDRSLLEKLNDLIEWSDKNRPRARYQCLIELSSPGAADDGVPIPWDAWVDIEKDKDGQDQLVLEGSAGASGFGYCKVVVPLAEASDYQIEVQCFGVPVPEWLQGKSAAKTW